MTHSPNEIFPDDDQGHWVHLFGPTCWCQPVMLGSVLVHRPQVESKGEIQIMLLESARERLARR